MERLRQKDYQIERRNPEIRKRLANIFDYIDKKTEKESTRANLFTLGQIHKFFRIFIYQVKKFEEKGFVSPDAIQNDGRHPLYSRVTVACIIYLKRGGNNLTARQARELREIAEEVDRTRQEEKASNA